MPETPLWREDTTVHILDGTAHGAEGPISLEQFKELYRDVAQLAERCGRHLGKVNILLLTELTLVQFSTAPRLTLLVKERRTLRQADFEIVLSAVFAGNIQPMHLRAFVWTELKQNLILGPLVVLVFMGLLHLDKDYSTVKLINQMLVEADALFIGIFVLFTIGQNRDLLSSPELAESGFAHQLMQNDFYVTSMAIMSLLTAFVSTALTVIAGPTSTFIVPVVGLAINLALWPQVVTVASIALLAVCFLSVTRYYLRLMRTAIEGEMYTRLMGRMSRPRRYLRKRTRNEHSDLQP